MRQCANCLMPDTKPGLILNEEKICLACLHYKMRERINWDERFMEKNSADNGIR